MMKTSIGMQLLCRSKESEIEAIEEASLEKRPPIKDHLPFMKNLVFPIYGAYYTIITFRINTIKGKYYLDG